MRIVQCWDDGVEDDIRLCEILRKHGAKASFNLNPGMHGSQRPQRSGFLLLGPQLRGSGCDGVANFGGLYSRYFRHSQLRMGMAA